MLPCIACIQVSLAVVDYQQGYAALIYNNKLVEFKYGRPGLLNLFVDVRCHSTTIDQLVQELSVVRLQRHVSYWNVLASRRVSH